MLEKKSSRRSVVSKGIIAVLASALVVFAICLAGCGNSSSSSSSASKDKSAILVVSFGTSYNDNREASIGGIENAIKEANPGADVRRAFTAQIVIDKLKSRDNISIDNVTEALDRAVKDGVKELTVQPTHLMNGFEYQDLVKELDKYKSKFTKISLGEPLLTSDADYEAVIKGLVSSTKEYDDGQTAICYMGHGTEAESNKVYSTLQDKLKAAGYKQFFIGTVEAAPTCDDVIKAAKAAGYKKAVLLPLMVVAGDHANNDMADAQDAESWAAKFKAAGIETQSVIKGLGQIPEIQQIYVEHVKAATEKK